MAPRPVRDYKTVRTFADAAAALPDEGRRLAPQGAGGGNGQESVGGRAPASATRCATSRPPRFKQKRARVASHSAPEPPFCLLPMRCRCDRARINGNRAGHEKDKPSAQRLDDRRVGFLFHAACCFPGTQCANVSVKTGQRRSAVARPIHTGRPHRCLPASSLRLRSAPSRP